MTTRRTCPSCGGRRRARHPRDSYGRIGPMIFVCTTCRRNPREEIAQKEEGTMPKKSAKQEVDPRTADIVQIPGSKKTAKKSTEGTVEVDGKKIRVRDVKAAKAIIAEPVAPTAVAAVEDPKPAKPRKAEKPEAKKPAEEKHPEASANGDGLCTFAFRLSPAERDQIHKAAGSGKASRFVRGVAIAAARGDLEAIKRIVEVGA